MSPWKWFSAFDAQRAGMLTHVTENVKRMNEVTETIARHYADYDPEAVAMLKAELWKDTQDWDRLLEEQAEKSAALLLRTQTKEILKKLKEK